MNKRNALAAKVKAVNKANAEAAKLLPKLVEIFRPLVGQQVLKAAGGLLLKVEKVLPEFPDTHGLMVYRHSSNYNLAWTVKTCENIEGTHGCLYHEVTIYVGNLNGCVLTDLNTTQMELRTDYTVEEIEAARKKYEEVRRIADEARSALYPFGEHDS